MILLFLLGCPLPTVQESCMESLRIACECEVRTFAHTNFCDMSEGEIWRGCDGYDPDTCDPASYAYDKPACDSLTEAGIFTEDVKRYWDCLNKEMLRSCDASAAEKQCGPHPG